MKKLVLLGFICLTVFFAKAQQSKEQDDFTAYSQVMNKKADSAISKKDYPLTTSILTVWIDNFNKLSDVSKKNLASYAPSLYFYLAHFTALQGKNEEALSIFDKSVSVGYANYKEAANDSAFFGLRDNQKFKSDLLVLREKSDYSYILKNSGNYNKGDQPMPKFTYQDASAPELVNFKNKFNLDSVRGNGNEIQQIKNLLFWVHNVVRHDGTIGNPKVKNAIDLIAVCKKENRGINCRMLSTILKDAYQAEGFKARMVACMPKDTSDTDCHVITVVWSKSLNKWVWMDPTFYAWMSDDKGNLLNIEEVRAKIIKGEPLVLNSEANWNNKEKQTQEHYLDYMSKNLYWIQCTTKSEWDLETKSPNKPAIDFVNLYPGTYTTIFTPKKIEGRTVEYATNNPDYFWQKPDGK